MHEDERRVEMLASAYLAGEGVKPRDIAASLGISAVAVSRHLKQARKEYLREQVTFNYEAVDAETMRKVRQRVTHKRLQDQLNQLAKSSGQAREVSLRVFNCEPYRDSEERMARLGSFAAPLVRQLLLRSKSCGLTWGGMLKCVVTGLRDLPYPLPWTKNVIKVIPLSGEPLGEEPGSFSSSSLARDLSIIANGDQYDAPSLAMIPAFLPEGFLKYEREGAWKLFNLVNAYSTIFGQHRNGNAEQQTSRRNAPLAPRLEMILTSVGSHDRPLGFGRGLLFEKLGVSYDELKSLIVAEVGGVCIPRGNLSRKESEQMEIVENSWTGLQLKHLEACAERGSDPLKGPPGVVVVSGGSRRAAAICELIKKGLVNHLIIDEVLAEELTAATRPRRSPGNP